MAITDQDRRSLAIVLAEIGTRIRRYTLDLQLQPADLPKLDAAWQKWLEARKNYDEIADTAAKADLKAIERELLAIDRSVDLIQRSIVSADSLRVGIQTMTAIVVALALVVILYLYTHGVAGFDFTNFEFLAEWGPLKYVEVAFWSEFGVLCWLVFQAANYLARRDFDKWYVAWYVSTAVRAPFMSVILMMVVLEFVEWYGEGTWIQTYILEEGNKSYFIAFMSFCLGLLSDEASAITRELAQGIAQFIRAAAERVAQKLKSAVMPDSNRRS